MFLTIAFFSFLLAIGVRQTCIVFILPSYLMAVVQAIRRRSGILLPTLLLVVVPVGWSLFMEWLMLGEAGNIDAYIWYKNEVKLLLSGLLSLDLKVWARLVDSAFCAMRGLISMQLILSDTCDQIEMVAWATDTAHSIGMWFLFVLRHQWSWTLHYLL